MINDDRLIFHLLISISNDQRNEVGVDLNATNEDYNLDSYIDSMEAREGPSNGKCGNQGVFLIVIA